MDMELVAQRQPERIPERRQLDVTAANQNACFVLASRTISGDGTATPHTVKIKVVSERTTVTKNLKTGNTECVCV